MDWITFRANMLRGLIWTVGQLPLGVLYKAGDGVAWIMRKVIGYRKGVIYTNLSRAFPDKSYGWIEDMAKQYYSRLGELVAESIWFGGCTGEKGRKRLRKQDIYEHVNSEMMFDIADSKGVMCMKSHCGNWEIFGGVVEYNDRCRERVDTKRIFVVYKTMSDKVSDKVFYDNRRAPLLYYRGSVSHKNLIRHAVEHKDSRPMYVIAVDQSPYGTKHPAGIFLNQETQGMLGVFSLAAKLGFCVMYMRDERVRRGHYRLTYVIIEEDATGKDPEKMMRRFFDLLEADIRKDPVNWLWSHKRWKIPSKK